MVKNPPACEGGMGYTGSVPGSGRSLGAINGNSLHYFCPENSMDRGAQWAAVLGVIKVWTGLSTKIKTGIILLLSLFFSTTF